MIYEQRNHEAQGPHYLLHVLAMTTEGLHDKTAIAGELAARDIEIERLRAALSLAVSAMRAPIDGWKGEVERKALDAARNVCEQI